MKITRLAGFRTARFVATALMCAFALSAHAGDDAADKAKEQEEIRKVAQQTL